VFHPFQDQQGDPWWEGVVQAVDTGRIGPGDTGRVEPGNIAYR